MKKIILPLMLILCIFLSCSDDDGLTEPNDIDYLPLEVGNWWVFGVYYYDKDTETAGKKSHDYKYEVVEQTQFKGREAYKLHYMFNGTTVADSIYYSLEDNNIYLGGEHYGEEEPLDWYKFYDSDSNEWEILNYESNVNGTEKKIKITGIYEGDLEVSIDGQIYEAILIKHKITRDYKYTDEGQIQESNTLTIRQYQIVKEIGIIQSTSVYNRENIKDLITILEDYEIGN